MHVRTTAVNIGYILYVHINSGTGTETNVPWTSLPYPPRYGNSTRRWFAEALCANHPLVYYRSGGGSTGLRQVRPPLLSHTILTRETGTRIHPELKATLLAVASDRRPRHPRPRPLRLCHSTRPATRHIKPALRPGNWALSFIDSSSRPHSRHWTEPRRLKVITSHPLRPRPYLLKPAKPSVLRCTSGPTGYRTYQRRAIPHGTCRSQPHTRLAARGHQPNRTQTRGHSQDSAPMLPKAVVIGCGGGSSIRARDHRCHQPRLDTSRRANELEEGQQGTAGVSTTIVHTFIFSQAHLFMLESTPYFLETATLKDDLTPLLSTTGYCWKAVEMSAQQVRVLLTKTKTFVACT